MGLGTLHRVLDGHWGRQGRKNRWARDSARPRTQRRPNQQRPQFWPRGRQLWFQSGSQQSIPVSLDCPSPANRKSSLNFSARFWGVNDDNGHYTTQLCVGKCWERGATCIGSGRSRSETTSPINKGRQPRWWLYSRCCLPDQSAPYFSYFILTHNVSLSLDRSLFRNKLVNSVLTTSSFQSPIEGGRLACQTHKTVTTGATDTTKRYKLNKMAGKKKKKKKRKEPPYVHAISVFFWRELIGTRTQLMSVMSLFLLRRINREVSGNSTSSDHFGPICVLCLDAMTRARRRFSGWVIFICKKYVVVKLNSKGDSFSAP